ncbi:BPSS1780 family membrane protein [Pseudomarimonas arenosa]|uniref:DUF4013 domain-containing protein n=1 Tax=Pseudomarimonas arenosa TaxID=2774145 RepID=A0AAW3ZKL8_9GAMM|nr:BPSS1780 family membrane protein [Pseudomarimonas arenosa]MBD8525732.1 hypothetical protein [Pseudomarimonas arenosa]
MVFRRVEADRGIVWLRQSFELIRSNPGPFLLMGLVLAVLTMIPLLGFLAFAVFAQTLYGGIMFAADRQRRGEPAEFEHLFTAFRQPGKLPKMLALCLPGLAAGVLLTILAAWMLGGALLAGGLGSVATDQPEALALSLGTSGLVFVVIALAVGLLAYAAVFFATPNVMLREAAPLEAIKQSLMACRDNLAALLMFLLAVFVISFLLSLVLSWIPLLGSMLLITVLLPWVTIAVYFAHRDVFGDAANAPPPQIEV